MTTLNLTTDHRDMIRDAVSLAVRYWPNSHLGDYTPREDIRSAFKFIRSHAQRDGLMPAIGALEDDAYRHMDM
jgi:hypothetical protein